jgi:hypothetical protein
MDYSKDIKLINKIDTIFFVGSILFEIYRTLKYAYDLKKSGEIIFIQNNIIIYFLEN